MSARQNSGKAQTVHYNANFLGLKLALMNLEENETWDTRSVDTVSNSPSSIKALQNY